MKPTEIYQQLISFISDEKMFGLSTIQRWCAHYLNSLLGCIGDPNDAGRKSIEGRTDNVVQMIGNDRRLSIRDFKKKSRQIY